MAGNPILQQEGDATAPQNPTSQQEGEATAPQNPTSQQQGNTPSLQGRDLAINELFGLQNREDRNKYPGVDHFFCHVEKVCFPQFAEFNKAMWDVMKVNCTTDCSQQWEWCAYVIQTCGSLQNNNPTVGELATEFLSGHGQESVIYGELEENVQFAIVKALLHTLCWLSATIMPVVEEQDLVDVRTANGPVKALSLTALYNGMKISRPVTLNSTLGQIFHQINQAAVPTPMEEGGMDSARLTRATGDVVHEPCVTYASLRKYAGVRLKWVSTLSEHLSLDRDTTVLSVFQYPSVCAVRILNRNKCKVISNITNWLLPRRDYARPNEVENEERVCQQVILSYRLLFGQSTASRNLLKEELVELVELVESTAESTADDPFILRCIGKVRNTWKTIRSQWIRFWQRKVFRKLLKDELQESAAESTADDPFILQCIGKVRNSWKAIRSQWIRFWHGKTSRKLLTDESDDSTAESMPDDPFILQCIDKLPSSWQVWAGLAKPDAPFSAAILAARFHRDDGFIKEWSTYFAWIHFSSFRWRLLAIQTFGNDHPPRGFLDYVMDPRAPMQRAAARVGVVAVVLAVSFGTVQTSIAAQQLVEAQP